MNRALVTGGTRGVGFAIVQSMIKSSIPTIFTGRNQKDINNVIEKLNSPLVYGIPLDFANRVSVENFITKVDKLYIKPSIIIHNAGYLSLRPLEKYTNVEKLFMINTIGPIMITEHFLPNLLQNNYGHVIFYSPPTLYDEKVKLLRPYMQSKLAQTTYMKSLSYTLMNKNISVNSMWTDFPLWTDAISQRQVGKKEECVDPNIMAEMVNQIIHHENPLNFKGNELIDKIYLKKKNIQIKKFYLGPQSGISLDELFLKHLQKQQSTLKS